MDKVKPARLGVMAAGAAAAVVGATGVEMRRRRAAGERVVTFDTGMVRAVAARMTTPLLPDDYLRMINPLWTARELRGQVVEVIPETADAATLVIKPGWGWSFDYRPGQYVGIGVNVGGRWRWRSYSITSAPAPEKGTIAITVKAMPEGLLSAHLVRGLEPGTIVRLAHPQGDFVLPDPPPPKILFWTGGSGVTPVMAMLRTLDRRGTMPDVVHIHAAPSEEEFIFGSELRALSNAHPSYRLVDLFSDTTGTLRAEDLASVVPDWADRETWVCGPPSLLEAAEQHWRREDCSQRLHVERFTLQRTTSAEGGHVIFSKAGKEADVDGATTLLEAGEALGISMPFGCRMGICHSCVLPLCRGRVKDLRNGAEYEQNQNVQTCVTAAAGDCTLEI